MNHYPVQHESGLTLEEQCAAAMARIIAHINRKAAQQVRRMRESWAKS